MGSAQNKPRVRESFFIREELPFPDRNFDQPSYSTYKYRYIYIFIYLLYLFIFLIIYLFIEDIWRLLLRSQISILNLQACMSLHPKEEAGIWDNGAFEPAQIDRCLWNYQTSHAVSARGCR